MRIYLNLLKLRAEYCTVDFFPDTVYCFLNVSLPASIFLVSKTSLSLFNGKANKISGEEVRSAADMEKPVPGTDDADGRKGGKGGRLEVPSPVGQVRIVVPVLNLLGEPKYPTLT